MRPTPVYIICSPRPLVGKTLIARLLSEFLLFKNGNVAAFDVNLKEPSLLEYLPNITETAEIDDTFGKMALMDRVIINDAAYLRSSCSSATPTASRHAAIRC
jgi:hypothetical protein